MAFEFLNSINMCIKYLLFIFNFFFVITGIIIISVGAGVQAKYHGYTPFLDAPYDSIPSLLIAIGVIIFIVAFFGCCGAIKESYIMTLIFSVMLIIVFILELSAGISGYVLRNRTETILRKNLLDSLPKYYNNVTEFTQVWDDIQSGLGCCGIDGPQDWINSSIHMLPVRCCEIPYGTLGNFSCNNNTLTLYRTGCFSGMLSYVKSHAGSLGAAGICIAIVQLIGILFACHLTRRAKYETAGGP